MAMMKAEIVHISIQRDWRAAYDFASNPENMPQWASGLASGLDRDGEDWVASGMLGSARVRFAPRNDFGVIDHVVTIDGEAYYNALRIVANGDGCEVMFTLLQHEGVSDAQLAADAAHIAKDLATLKRLLER